MSNPAVIGVISLLIGYLCGNFVSGYFIGKKDHVDLRQKGSGNIGTTNTFRVLGIKAGIITFILDAMKAIVATWIVYGIFHTMVNADMLHWFQMLGAFGAVLGHDFPFFMHFKGGKGIATSAGMIIAIYPQVLPGLLAIFIIIVAISRYVSLGSIICAVSLFIEVVLFGQLGLLNFPEHMLPWVYVVTAMAALLAIWRHKANIGRLLAGNENKVHLKKKKE